jgi:serine/threonine protein kinase
MGIVYRPNSIIRVESSLSSSCATALPRSAKGSGSMSRPMLLRDFGIRALPRSTRLGWRHWRARPSPYIAMELVEGDPILVHCRAQRLSTNATLEILARVCDGVQHAHAHGVIHRDLKGSNILVTPSEDGIGQPRILDFGVARIIGDEREALTMPVSWSGRSDR